MFLVTKTGWAPVASELQSVVERTYDEYDSRYSELLTEQYKRVAEGFAETAAKMTQQATPAEIPQLATSQQESEDNSTAAD
jgi:hypothetical protein